MSTKNAELRAWVDATAKQTKPDRVHWCDGSPQEAQHLLGLMQESGDLIALNAKTHPNCFLHRSDPSDVARTEHLTFICTESKADAGPNNNWMAPDEAHRMLDGLYDGCMKGRTMYVVPYVMGPLDSPYASPGVEITDSPYVVVSMGVMTRMGKAALERIEAGNGFIRGVHSNGDLSPERRFITHFPQERLIRSIGSGYGGNALLGKKCHSLRLGSWDARNEGWLAEHMLIVGIETPEGETHYVAAAFPSACGKTNLAMLNPPGTLKGYKVWTVGEDIAWMHLGSDGRLWAINPEAGIFGVAPGTGPKTNVNMMEAIKRDTIFTNVAVTADGEPWWEGLTDTPPDKLVDWQGRPYTPGNGPAAHPNSRFTVDSRRLPSYSQEMEAPQGVPISAILFGGRRASVAPLVFQSLSWEHGVFLGAAMGSETTAAATGQVGVVRRDPMAMLPFCGYNFADYWGHWLSFAGKSDKLPKIFHVNWFRRGADGHFLWPGFGENLRVMRWVLERCQGKGAAQQTPIGYVPTPEALDSSGLNLSGDDMRALLSLDHDEWMQEIQSVEGYFATYGDRLPAAIAGEARRVHNELAQG